MGTGEIRVIRDQSPVKRQGFRGGEKESLKGFGHLNDPTIDVNTFEIGESE